MICACMRCCCSSMTAPAARAASPGPTSPGPSVDRARLGPALFSFGAALAHRGLGELARAIPPLAGEPGRTVGVDLRVERERCERRAHPRGVTEADGAQPGIGHRHPVAEVI